MPGIVVKQFWMDSTQWPTPAAAAPAPGEGALFRPRRRREVPVGLLEALYTYVWLKQHGYTLLAFQDYLEGKQHGRY